MTHIPEALRRQVIARARGCCEYCLIHQDDVLAAHEVDHILAEKHRGATILENLCLSCLRCNRHKGSDFASIDVDTGEVAMLFNPRTDQWTQHFA
jgi:5-methylcytosine-specific restriction endonuclease McrA